MKTLAAALFLVSVFAITTTGSTSGCAGGDGDGAEAGDQDLSRGACNVFSVPDNRPLTASELTKLGDPIARRVLLGGCPQKLDGIISSLKTAPDCKNSVISTRLVSDRSELLGKPDIYRGVLTEDCAGASGGAEALVSIFGITTNAPTLPQDGIEMIGHDTTNGVFNFYVNEGGWKFMGSSKNAVADGYDCGPHGDCEPKAAKKARCWACHEGGGLNMKELQTPWNSWDVNNEISGDQVFAKFPSLGTRNGGVELEGRIEIGNEGWAKKRVETLKSQGVAEVLRPLFCTLTVNIESSGVRGDVLFVPSDFAYEAVGFDATTIDIDNGAYQKAITANHQRFVDRNGQPVGTANESPNGFLYVAKGDVDRRYMNALQTAGVVDLEFVSDVMNVDFTRPIFSPTRCGLLAAAPKLAAADMTPEKIRQGFLTNLRGSTAPGAAQLLKNLSANDIAAHQKDVDAFTGACKTRDKQELVNDILRYNAHLKLAAKNHRASTPEGSQGILEFSETFPVDDLPDTNLAFDPATCTLK
jgi:hypothetical protein